jgi:hypothetical protein
MAGTIGSVVNRVRMPKLIQAHAVGLMLGALTTALVLSLLGALARPALREFAVPLKIAAIPVLLGWAFRTMDRRGLPFPHRSWQVPERWRYTLPPMVTLGSYGYLLGVGGLTYMVLPTYWLLVGGTIAVSLPVALAAWTAFALGRLLTAWRGARLVAAGSEDVTPHNLRLTRAAGAALLTSMAIALSVQIT